MAATELRGEIEAFLFEEAKLLDGGRFHEWLDLFTEDVRYWMPVREMLATERSPDDPDELAFGLYDEDKTSLLLRVKRLDTGLARAEEPRSITRHLISNVLVSDSQKPDEVLAESSFLVFQLRHKRQETYFVGTRQDVLRKEQGRWKIARRKILLDQLVLPRTLSIFF